MRSAADGGLTPSDRGSSSTSGTCGACRPSEATSRHYGQLDLSADPALELTIEAASVHTGNRKRDQHLRSVAFFDAEHHPRVQFLADSVALRHGTLEVRGRLSARGQSIPLKRDAQVRQVDGALEIEASIIAPHRELGMTYSPLGMISPRTDYSVEAYLITGRGSPVPARRVPRSTRPPSARCAHEPGSPCAREQDTAYGQRQAFHGSDRVYRQSWTARPRVWLTSVLRRGASDAAVASPASTRSVA